MSSDHQTRVQSSVTPSSLGGQLHRQTPVPTDIMVTLPERPPIGALGGDPDALADWLIAAGVDEGVREVLHLVLRRDDLGSSAVRIIAAAVAWLDANGLEPGAGFVLAPLLERSDLGPLRKVIGGKAHSWLSLWGQEVDARHVLRPVLATPLEANLQLGLGWLERHHTSIEADYVLVPLLGAWWRPVHPDVGRYLALWLDAHGESLAARYVLRAALRNLEYREVAIDRAVAWLKQHGETRASRFVVEALLGAANHVGGAIVSEAHGVALRWLEAHGKTPDARYVLGAMSGAQAMAVAESFIDPWLALHDGTAEAAAVLAVSLTGTIRVDRVDRAMRWLDAHRGQPEARFVLSRLLAATSEFPAHRRRVIDHGLAYLDEFGHLVEARFVLRGLIDQGVALDRARGWLDVHGGASVAGLILGPMLAMDGHRSLGLAVRWLDGHGQREDASYVAEGLLRRRDLTGVLTAVVRASLAWLDGYPDAPGTVHVLAALVARLDLSGGLRREAVERGRVWAMARPTDLRTGLVLAGLLRHQDADAESLAMSWLECHGSELSAYLTVNRLLRRSTAPIEAVRMAVGWLAEHSDADRANFIYDKVLRRADLDDPTWAKAATLAVHWLGSRQTITEHAWCIAAVSHRLYLLDDRSRSHWRKIAGSWQGLAPVVPAAVSNRIAKGIGYLDGRAAGPDTLRPMIRAAEETLGRGEVPANADLVQLAETAVERARVSPAAAAFALPALIAGLSHWDDEAIEGVVRELLSDSRLLPRHRKGIRRALLRRIDDGWWPSLDMAMAQIDRFTGED